MSELARAFPIETSREHACNVLRDVLSSCDHSGDRAQRSCRCNWKPLPVPEHASYPGLASLARHYLERRKAFQGSTTEIQDMAERLLPSERAKVGGDNAQRLSTLCWAYALLTAEPDKLTDKHQATMSRMRSAILDMWGTAGAAALDALARADVREVA